MYQIVGCYWSIYDCKMGILSLAFVYVIQEWEELVIFTLYIGIQGSNLINVTILSIISLQELQQHFSRMKLILLALAFLILGVISNVTARRSRTKRELAPGLHSLGMRDAGGSYCQQRNACCPGRDDACTVPYLDTICYCDLFCNRTVSDCCPDFWGYCLGISPPESLQKGELHNQEYILYLL